MRIKIKTRTTDILFSFIKRDLRAKKLTNRLFSTRQLSIDDIPSLRKGILHSPERNARAFSLLALNRRENDEKLDCPPNMRAALDANFPPTIQASATLAIFQFHRQKHLA